jgi:hypothetical protein
MSIQEELPAPVIDLIQSSSISQYATVSAAGVPIDTPVLFFPSAGLGSIDLATGLSYPAKAERARSNPHVGLWIEGRANEPVISIAGMAAVKDCDLQANVDRYLSEAAYTLAHNPDWSLARQAVWYWTRMLVQISPASIVWWDNLAAMDRAPNRWTAPAGTLFPISDPAPPGKTSKPAKWQEKPWQDLAAQALGRGAPGHLSVIDADGFPRPMRTRGIAMSDTGFSLDLAAGVPWAMKGKACLTFGGIESFVGEVSGVPRAGVSMVVERTLPIFPMTQDMTQLWEPTDDTRTQLMRRLTEEAQRRGQPIPKIPIERPEPTEGYKRRMARRGGA